MPPDLLRGRTCVVTGGGKGLGRAFALGLGVRGARVVVADVDGDAAQRVADEVGERGLAVTADCTDPDHIDHVLDEATQRHGAPPDGLVNNAGVLDHAPLLEVDDDRAETVLRVNTLGPIRFTRAFARRLVERSLPGAVVNITSTTAHVASLRGLSTYAASKGGLLAFTRGAAADLAAHDIRVNAVSPGWMRTEMSAGLDAHGSRLLGRIPMGRPATPDELVGAVAFFLSDEAGYVTGTCLPVDGGWLGY